MTIHPRTKPWLWWIAATAISIPVLALTGSLTLWFIVFGALSFPWAKRTGQVSSVSRYVAATLAGAIVVFVFERFLIGGWKD